MPRLIAYTLLLLTSSCGLEVGTPFSEKRVRVSDSQSRYSYEYEQNGCSTGSQKFNSLREYCQALLDDNRNHDCARSMREQAHAENCKQN